MTGINTWSGSYEVRVVQADNGFVVEVRRDGAVIKTRAAVSIEDLGPLAAGDIATDVAARLDGA
jgi:hypothetical protein